MFNTRRTPRVIEIINDRARAARGIEQAMIDATKRQWAWGGIHDGQAFEEGRCKKPIKALKEELRNQQPKPEESRPARAIDVSRRFLRCERSALPD